ncbi:unnamed protein product [Gongylonema pulchrum]|uniref:Uncharacterized protein n=1 Tax=Gongylonema pulchrum TaxID=637853 RepID=A0A3P7NS67_9BILA|nr:unnamed protein product [Gongylonema pulchrum]
MLEEQKYVVPTFDLQRRLGNVFAQFRYRKLFEKEFTVEGFLNGAIQVLRNRVQGRSAVFAVSVDEESDCTFVVQSLYKRIMTEEAVSELQQRFDPFDEDYFKPLNFSINDVICSVIDSSYTCGKMQPDSLFSSEFVGF